MGNLSGKGGDVFEKVMERVVCVCCFHRVRWRGEGLGMGGV